MESSRTDHQSAPHQPDASDAASSHGTASAHSAASSPRHPAEDHLVRARDQEERSALLAVTVFPVLILAAGALAFFFPASFTGLAPAVTPLLGLIMFFMGITLTWPDFALVAQKPVPVIIGVIAHYIIMPGLGLTIALLLHLPAALAVGVILVGCCPSGSSSNVVTYLSKGDVALGVAMASVSTLLAPVMTPLLATWLVPMVIGGTSPLHVDGAGMVQDILLVVLVPVVAGLLVRLVLPRIIDVVAPALPWISVAAISVIVMAVVAGSAAAIRSAGVLVLLAVVLHNCCGYLLGYGAAALFRVSPRARRTTAVEVGMQNSALAVTLAKTVDPHAALPGAIFSVWHNVSGAVFAMVMRRRATD